MYEISMDEALKPSHGPGFQVKTKELGWKLGFCIFLKIKKEPGGGGTSL